MVEATLTARSNTGRNDFVPWSAQAAMQGIPTVMGGEGAYFRDSAGRRYPDFSSRRANANPGHRQPRIVEAARQRAERGPHVPTKWNRMAVAPPSSVAPDESDEGLGAIDGTL